jgi:hypothetical protein
MAGLEAKIKGFMRYPRKKHTLRDPNNGLVDMDEIFTSHNSAPVEGKIKEASRCMDCGVPFCQSDTGCPISNLIPEFKALVYADKWEEAYRTLIKTNNLPEFTGRACPAPCEVHSSALPRLPHRTPIVLCSLDSFFAFFWSGRLCGGNQQLASHHHKDIEHVR